MLYEMSDEELNLPQALIKLRADVIALPKTRQAPLYPASSFFLSDLPEYSSLLSNLPEYVTSDKANTVQVLIEHGADVTVQDITYSTPLHLASLKECGKTVKLLLTQGADISAQDGRQSTPLHQRHLPVCPLRAMLCTYYLAMVQMFMLRMTEARLRFRLHHQVDFLRLQSYRQTTKYEENKMNHL